MKNLFILIPHLSDGGAERVASLISKFVPNNIKITYILFENRISYDHNGEIIILDVKAKNNYLNKFVNVFKRYIKLKQIIKVKKPDAILSFLESANLINILCNFNNAIVSVRAHPSTTYKNDWLNRLIIKLYRFSKKVIAVSNEIKKDLIENFGLNEDKIEVIYNPADIETIKKLSTEEIEDELKDLFYKNEVIITCGRLNVQKDHKTLINAFNLALPHLKPNTKLAILGSGELEFELKKLVNILNLNNKIYFLGYRKNPYKYISKSKLFVLSSLYEGFPNSIIEAMICNVPIISSNCSSGPAEMFNNAPFSNLFEPKNEAQLASKLITFYFRNNLDMFKFYEQKLKELDGKLIVQKYLKAVEIDIC